MPTQRIDYRARDALNDLFFQLPRDEVRRAAEEVRAACVEVGLTYVDDDGAERIIDLLLRPRIINPVQRSYFHYVCLQVADALKKLPALYLADAQVRRVLPLGEVEERWLRDAWGKGVPRHHTIITRLDANTDFTADDWLENFQFFEANSVGIGGLYYAPAAERILLDVIGPRLRRLDPELFLEPNYDMRDLLLDELRLHAREIGCGRCNIAFLDDPRNVGGITEYPHLAEYFQAKGYRTVVADPRECHWHGDELFHRDLPLDVVYRDLDVHQCIALADEGSDVGAIRKAFEQNRVVSSLAGDFDQKSCWELFTDDRFAHYFTAAQWRMFNRHMLWTRLIRDTRTTEEAGRMIDLVPYAARNRESLVLKPNREFGGVGVTIGPEVTQSQWESVLHEAASRPNTSVVQRYTPVRCKRFPFRRPDGNVTSEEFFVTCGFVPGANNLGILGRASLSSIVNVALHGGLTPILMILDQQRL